MKLSTINKYIDLLTKIKESGLSILGYCNAHNINPKGLYNLINNLRRQNEIENEAMLRLIEIYNSISKNPIIVNNIEEVETDDKAEISYIRDDEGKIQYYFYQIYRQDKLPLTGKLSREEMTTIHRLYSYYGDSLTQRVVSRHFVDLSLIDFRRILRAFNITKASGPFPPHMLEELSEEELREIQLREKENSFLRKAEEDQIRNNEKLLRKYAQENIELKRQLETFNNFKIEFSTNLKPIDTPPANIKSVKNINLYLADMHIGAAVWTGAMYKENIGYGRDEVIRRLTEVYKRLQELGQFDTINLVLCGDNIDCAGVFGKTARLDHDMPENMDPKAQVNTFIEVVIQFIHNIIYSEYPLCNQLNVYSVPEGNHGGFLEYTANKALMATINAIFPRVKTTLFEEFYGKFEQNGETFIVTHGKDMKFMKKGFPNNLDDKTKVLLYEWLTQNNLLGKKVHVIKGDLHSDNFNSCYLLDYRNVLSLFGASDYANYNFSRNSYGISYDLFINNNLVKGTFENI